MSLTRAGLQHLLSGDVIVAHLPLQSTYTDAPALHMWLLCAVMGRIDPGTTGHLLQPFCALQCTIVLC
jgi:hypothetical protein